MSDRDSVKISVRVLHVTKNAYGVTEKRFGNTVDTWLPFSLIDGDGYEGVHGEVCDMVVPRWLADKEEFTYEEMV